MKINIYYGGRGLIEDPTLHVITRITEVLEELRAEVTKYNLYEEKSGITMLPKTLKEADGIILATQLEWLGIGGYMQQFLDACWLYGDKEKIGHLYMMPIIMATTYGEKEARMQLEKSWEMLGGLVCDGISAYVEDHVDFELNASYNTILEKKAEYLYRVINQKVTLMPSSDGILCRNLTSSISIPLTPQESEQMSVYVSDDAYVKKQKADIEVLSMKFREMLGDSEEDANEYIRALKNYFHPLDDFKASYLIEIKDAAKNLVIEVDRSNLKCYYGELEDADVVARTSRKVMNQLVSGHTTFQKAFMSGDLSAKGNFKTLRTFDTVFQFHTI